MAEPFVGMRPYREVERPLFVGREQDALRLENKVFSGPLTVLFAPSGVGKTSLIRTLLIPDLRTKGNHAFYFDAWSADDPAAVLKTQLLRSAHLDPSLASESLTDVIKRVGHALSQPLVLVLDQFEHFLSTHAHSPEPLRRELAAVVRCDELDAYTLLSLREEYLGALDLFRGHLLTLLQSTFRLNRLSDLAVREAIIKPVALFGGSCEKDLVTLLTEDLRTPAAAAPEGAASAGFVELPILQVVCLRLWREAVASGQPLLTWARYQALQGRDGILRDYVRSVMDQLSRREKDDVARVLDYLAPHSGAKMPYALAELARRTQLMPERIRRAVEHLNRHCIVRIRGTDESPSYELYHDASIRVLRGWVNRCLERMRFRRRVVQGLVVAAVVGVGTRIAFMGYTQLRENVKTDGYIEMLRQLPSDSQRIRTTEVLDGLAFHLVAKQDSASIEKLLNLLAGVRTLSEQYYGTPREVVSSQGRSRPAFNLSHDSAGAVISDTRLLPPPGTVAWGDTLVGPLLQLRLRYNPSAQLEMHELEDQWSEMLVFMIDSLGFAGSTRASLEVTDSAPLGVVQLGIKSGKRDTTITIRLPSLDSLLVPEGTLPPYYFRGDGWEWARVGFAEHGARTPGGQLRVAPRWTLPLWKAKGQIPRSREKHVALTVERELAGKPELLLDGPKIESLLRRERRRSPDAVERALAAWGGPEGVRSVLLGILRTGRSITRLRELLAAMAEYPDSDATEAGKLAWEDAVRATCKLPRPGAVDASPGVAAHVSREVESLLASQRVLAQPSGSQVPLNLCLLESYVAEQRFSDAISLADRLLKNRDETAWTPEQEYLFGFWLLALRDELGFPTHREEALSLLASAYRVWQDSVAERTYSELRHVCVGGFADGWSRGRNWCWRLLDSLGSLHPRSLWVSLSLGYDLAQVPGRDAAARALALLERAGALLVASAIPLGDQPRLQAFVDYGTAQALLEQARFHDSTAAIRALRILRPLANSVRQHRRGWPEFGDVAADLANAYLLVDSLGLADSVVNARSDNWEERFFFRLARGDLAAAEAVADSGMDYDPLNSHALFRISLVQLLRRRPGADSTARRYLRSEDNFRDYILLILSWYLRQAGHSEAARQLVEARWKAINRSTWPRRLEQGDQDVWREMLVGYYAGAIKRSEISGPLESVQSLQESALTHTGYSLPALRCEAYFYDALLHWDRGDANSSRREARDLLRKAIATRHVLYYEYHLAAILSKQSELSVDWPR